MWIVEELVQRAAAFLLTAVWFVVPLGAAVVHRASVSEIVEIDDTRRIARETRVVVWAPEPREPERGDAETEAAPVPATDAPEIGSAGDGGGGAAVERGGDRPTVWPQPGRRPGTPMRRPGSVRGRADGAGRDKARPDCEEPDPRVEKIGDGTWRVARDLIDEYAADRERLLRLGWVARHEDARGRRDGFQVRGISCGNLLAQVGLRNRDVVHTINGRKVNTILQAIAAYRKLRREERIEIEITRRGETKFLVYEVI